MDGSVRLAVDLGTTHTVAVVRRGGQEPRALLFDGTPLLSSGVFVDESGGLHTGRDGARLGGASPERFEPHPKRRVDEGTVLLGEHEVPVEQLLAASLRRVADEARTAGVSPDGATVLTCPADWGQPRRNVLRAAAWRAGLGQVTLLDEPIAAATYCVQVLGQQVPPGGCLGVFDFGGGTFDVAVVRREPAGLRVLATGGLDDLGGLDVDSALVAHLGHLVAVRDPELWRRLEQPADAEQRRERQAFWSEVRAAKEMLSRTSSAPVHVPGRAEPMHLTREELERVGGPLVARAVDETRRVLQRAGVEPERLAGLLLVGGASRMPLVASRLHGRLGVAPSVPEQPELPVAYGALVYAMAAPGAVATGGVAGPAFPVSGPFGSPAGPYPVSSSFPAGVVSAPIPGSPGLPGAGLPPPPPPAVGPGVPPPRPPMVAPVPRKRRPVRRALLTGTVFVLVGGLVAGVVQGGRWLSRTLDGAGKELDSGLQFGQQDGNGAGKGELASAEAVPLSQPGAAAVAVSGQDVVVAAVGSGITEVKALPSGGGPARWTTQVPIEPEGVKLTAVGDLVVLDGDNSVTDGGNDMRAVLSAGSGKLLWRNTWERRTDVAFLGTDVLVDVDDSHDGHAVLRVDLRTGRQKWRLPGGEDTLTIDEHRIEPVRQWVGVKGGVLPAFDGVLHDALTAGNALVELEAEESRGRLVDAATGKVTSTGTLPLENEYWTVFGGVVVGVQNDEVGKGREVLAAYKVPGFGRAWTLGLPAGQTVERVKPCGEFLVCAAVEADAQSRVVAVDVRSGKEAWSAPVESGDDAGWYVTSAGLLVGEATFGPISDARALGPDGKELGRFEDTSAQAVQGGRAVLRVTRLAGTEVMWQVFVAEVAGGKATKGVDVGADVPEQIVLAGDVVAVLTKDREVMVLRVMSVA
ncbi:Hsp70 family protein [Phytohabitans kaempferiae]|uniref:Hsp70 family protein n=1 Tax=Phytohabitans kaempferiae TaxID=1620943 RepID=A0ABV6MFV4_9ACTN